MNRKHGHEQLTVGVFEWHKQQMIIDEKEDSLKLQRYYIVLAERSSAGRMVPVQIFHLFSGEKERKVRNL